MGLSTHVLDIAAGCPAVGVHVTLRRLDGDTWFDVGEGTTNVDGRITTLLGGSPLIEATYCLRFATAEYFAAREMPTLYPFIYIVFTIANVAQHFHIPLLLTANSYSTYRGT